MIQSLLLDLIGNSIRRRRRHLRPTFLRQAKLHLLALSMHMKLHRYSVLFY
jgi:hypothetical protein